MITGTVDMLITYLITCAAVFMHDSAHSMIMIVYALDSETPELRHQRLLPCRMLYRREEVGSEEEEEERRVI